MATVVDFSPSHGGRVPLVDRGACVYTAQYCEENVWHLLHTLAAAAEALPPTAPSPPLSPSAHDYRAAAQGGLQLVPDVGRRYSLSSSPAAPSPAAAAAAAVASGALELYTVVITNPNRQAMLWCQRNAASPSRFVVWDYHVVAVARDPISGTAYVYDLDSTLDFPCPMDEYLWKTFRPNIVMDQHFASIFRVIPAHLYWEGFASDRSHMRMPDGGWVALPPPYPPIRGVHGDMTLPAYLDLSRETVGARSSDDTVVVRLNGLARRFGVTWPSPVADDLGRLFEQSLPTRPPVTKATSGGDISMDGDADDEDDEDDDEDGMDATSTDSVPGMDLPVPVHEALAAQARAPSVGRSTSVQLAPSQLAALLARRGSAPGVSS